MWTVVVWTPQEQTGQEFTVEEWTAVQPCTVFWTVVK
jgi:hypothetical protein